LNTFFSKQIIDWYKQNKRDLPWRQTKDPYKIWLSEIILQQTQVKQGLPYYKEFVSTFPNVYKLAEAKESKIMKMWQGLGYYSRARNLHYTAKTIVKDYDGKFPDDYNDLLKLKGIGHYTAAAIASFAYDEAVAVLDGNVYRVLSRFFGIDTPINSTHGQKYFKIMADEVLDRKKPALHNQAMMEYGALVCKPKSPDCMFCSLNSSCVAFQQNKTKTLPVKLKKLKRKKRFFNYIFIESVDKNLILSQRLNKDIWQKLYEFPLIESKSVGFNEDINTHEVFEKLGIDEDIQLKKINDKTYKHVLTHQDIFADFWYVSYPNKFPSSKLVGYDIVNSKSIRNFAVPILIDKFLKEHIISD